MWQNLPPLKVHTQQLTTVCTWFIWQGATIRFPITTLQRPKEQGDWALKNISVKFLTLLLSRIWMLSARELSVTVAWMHKWNLTGTLVNPPQGNRIPTILAYIRHYAIDMAYVTPPGNTESLKKFKQRIYGVLQKMATAGSETTDMLITRKHPCITRARVRTNLHKACVSETLKLTWYVVIREIVPTNERLAAIRLAGTDRCIHCRKTDSLQHRIAECGEGYVIWTWIRARIAALLRMDPKFVPADWTLRPTFHFWLPQKHAAII